MSLHQHFSHLARGLTPILRSNQNHSARTTAAVQTSFSNITSAPTKLVTMSMNITIVVSSVVVSDEHNPDTASMVSLSPLFVDVLHSPSSVDSNARISATSSTGELLNP
jgi:hypothetical protein